MKHKAFVAALEDLTGHRLFLRFGGNATVNDIMDVINEEVQDNKGAKILGLGFLEANSSKRLIKMNSEWKKHFDRI